MKIHRRDKDLLRKGNIISKHNVTYHDLVQIYDDIRSVTRSLRFLIWVLSFLLSSSSSASLLLNSSFSYYKNNQLFINNELKYYFD